MAALQENLKQTEQEKLNKEAEIEDLNGKIVQLTAEKNRSNNHSTQLQTQNLKDENKKLPAANDQGRKQSDYASAAFVVAGAFTVVASLTMSYLAVCITLATAASIFFAVGCYCSYKVNRALDNVKADRIGLDLDHTVA